MTKKSKHLTSNAKSILILATTLIISMILLLCSACGGSSSESTSSDKDYSKTETDTAIINNGSFELGTYSLALSSFPKTSSITGWSSISADNSADTSDVNSGVVNTTSEGWTELINKLYKDKDFLNYAKDKFSITSADETEIKTAIKTAFPSPSTHDGKGKNVLMINNITERYEDNIGTAQKTTSSTTVTLEKGEYGYVSVWVKTVNIENSSVSDAKGGANIRLVNTFNSSSQADYAIYGIDTNGEWTEYKIYVKGDANYTTTLKVVLGLGFGNGSNWTNDWVQGTAFFDDVTFTEIEEADYVDDNASSMVYNGEDAVYQNVGNNTSFAYDMTFTTPTDYFSELDFFGANPTGSAVTEFTTTNKGEVGFDNTGSINATNSDKSKITINPDRESYTLTITDDGFAVNPEGYKYLSFNVKNELDKYNYKNAITVYIYDGVIGNANTNVTKTALTFEEIGEEKTVGLMLKNNFETGVKNFQIQIVVGPTDVTNKVQADYPVGKVTIDEFKIADGKSYQYLKDGDDGYVLGGDKETDYYDYYSFYSSVANSTVALYYGNSGDFTEDTNSENYAFSSSPSSFGDITTKPANVSGYNGISSNSNYIKLNGSDAKINAKVEEGKAGLVNTKYLNNYGATLAGYLSGLNGFYTSDKNIQPLMINVDDAKSYGFIGSSTLTVSASAYAKISVDVLIVGEAKANVYLVDAYGEDKEVLKLDDFTVNTGDDKGTNFNDNEFALSVSDTDGDWVTLTFYVATGATAKKFRLEMWNGSRDVEATTNGIVFYDNVSISTSSAFSEYTGRLDDVFTDSASVLYGKENATEKALYLRELDETEIEYNSENPDEEISYDAKYVWVKTNDTVYAVFNSIDPVAIDPYASEETDDTTSGNGCAKADPSTFWLSFSSILLGAVLLLAIVMLIVKNVVKKRKANASDAKSHYKVTSRVSYKNTKKETKVEVEEPITDDIVEPEVTEEETTEEKAPETLDEYVYGDVQDFGETETNENSSDEKDE